ncbi:MAG: hypothetical protein IJP30_00045 [Clostridia bacterium]|nr:hypothetical protein [Clostridia bacterium]
MENKQKEMEKLVEQALCEIAFDMPGEGRKPATAAERLKALELLGRQYGLFSPQAQTDTIDLSGVTVEELRQWAQL